MTQIFILGRLKKKKKPGEEIERYVSTNSHESLRGILT